MNTLELEMMTINLPKIADPMIDGVLLETSVLAERRFGRGLTGQTLVRKALDEAMVLVRTSQSILDHVPTIATENTRRGSANRSHI